MGRLGLIRTQRVVISVHWSTAMLLVVLLAMGCSGSKTISDEEVSPDVRIKPACKMDDECAHLTTNCGKGVCAVSDGGNDGECTVKLRPLGSPCDVELDCALGRCISGVCSPEIILDCNDNNACTDDICDMVKGCLHLPMDGACDDNNPCTEDDACVAKTCTGGNYICDECTDNAGCEQYNDQDACNGILTCDTATNQCHIEAGSISSCISSNPCLSAVCNVATGQCEEYPRPNGTPCSDNNLCSLEDRCAEGQCVGTPLLCPSSGKGCVVTHCAPKSACVDTALHGQPCQDGNQCTNDDVCAEGTCTGTTVETCTCIQDADCALYDDADLCNGQVRCMGGHCLVDPTTIPTCTLPGVPCVTVQCVAETGQCAETFTVGPCSDGDLCTVSDQCTEGACIGEPAVCDDANECTTDSCDALTGCSFELIAGCNEPCLEATTEPCNGCGIRTCTGEFWGPCEGGITCEGKSCGGDGCDGVCGECAANEACTDGQCVVVPPCNGECDLGDTGSQGCGNCGNQSRSCTDQCTWGAWSDCGGQGPCSPNANQGCGECGDQTCDGNCQWGSCENQGCPPSGPTNCEGCLNGYADCTAACQAAGYTSGTCNVPDSTDPGACCGCQGKVIPPPTPGQEVKGFIDSVIAVGSTVHISGWACYVTWPGSIPIHIYSASPGGPYDKFLGAIVAENPHEDEVANSCGTAGTEAKHRYTFVMSASEVAEHKGRTLNVHGISPLNDGNTPLLAKSGKFTVP